MLPRFSKIVAGIKPCFMCKQPTGKKAYLMITAFEKREISPVCKNCALHEYYGSKKTSSKRFRNDIEKGSLLGIANE